MFMKKNFKLVAGLVITGLIAWQCNNKKETVPSGSDNTSDTVSSVTPEGHKDSAEVVKKDSIIKPERPKVSIKSNSDYSAWPMKGNDSLRKVFLNTYKGEELHNILALNRLDRKNMGQADTLIVPNKLESNFLAYSPFPEYVEAMSSIPKIAFFSYPIQAYALYENGKLVKWGPTSMGSKAHQTTRGLHFTNWKGKEVISTVSDEWKLKWNFNIANHEGIGWHQYSMPGYPASHSCLRLLEEDAKWMYDWGEQWVLNKGGATVRAKGNPVIVYGDYPWGQRRPWKKLMDDPKANDISEQQLTDIVTPYLAEIKKEQDNRVKVLEEVKREKEQAKQQQDTAKPKETI
ncbi:ErfK/YbiS/YcfS/YnhG family protein [Elizabethkingia meningoseptica ATCC 13253 = NBRC 12535]|nr:ErfK/YbiS/YcfS/YnhG family protein [Elizabethkingia meningoseptica ATCC 13253 = NBRC 12535]